MKGIRSEENVLESWEIKLILDDIQKQKFEKRYVENLIFKSMIGLGTRIGELSHAHISWLKDDVLEIPYGFTCECSYCTQRSWNKFPSKYKINRKGDYVLNRFGEQVKEYREVGNWYPKNRQSARKIALFPDVKILLEGYFAKYDSFIDVCISPDNARMIINRINKRLEGQLKNHLHSHCLRATYMDRLISEQIKKNKGFVDYPIIAKAMGHKKLDTVLNYLSAKKQMELVKGMSFDDY